MLNKLILSEKDYEYLTKGLAVGVGIGIIFGAIFDDVILLFALGGVIGIIGSVSYSLIKKVRRKT